MTISNQILSEITIFNKYAKFKPEFSRRETWQEICDRYENMMVERYPQLTEDITTKMLLVRNKQILPSMRAMQFAGLPIFKNESRIYNCAYFPVDNYKAFSEAMFLLLGGTGVGFSVQKQHVDQLPAIKKPIKEKKFIIGDSLEGWADAIKALVKSYLGYTQYKPKFNFSDIRHKGVRLVTAGGKAPGPEPLKICLAHMESIFERKENGDKLKPIDCHDLMCHIADAVLSGGIRRSAMISLFSHDDQEMLECKFGAWWELNAQRGRANNSVVLDRATTTEQEFKNIWKKIELSGSGEPGVYWTNNLDWGTNPCCEIALRPYQFCNLCEVNVSDITSQDDLNTRVSTAAFFGTLQAGFTDFHYLRSIWKKTTEEDALIGVGMTGIGSGTILNYDLNLAAELAKATNKHYAAILHINEAARVTTIKPSGTTSCVLGTSSGIHAWHNDYYLRRIRLMKNDPLYFHLAIHHPELIEDDQLRSDTAIITIPQEAPQGSILRTESAMQLLDRISKFNLEWVRNGHRKGDNTNNVSATVSIKPEEWIIVGDWMWHNKHTYNGISVLPYDNGSYIQAPFENCTKAVFDKLSSSLKEIDLTKVIENEDGTNFTDQAACAGGACEIK
jgi:ribonucleoside-triphosphate reductase (thioredoxin)